MTDDDSDADTDPDGHPRATKIGFIWEDDGFQHPPDGGEYKRFAGAVSFRDDLASDRRTTLAPDPADFDTTYSGSITLDAHTTATLLGWLEDGMVCAVCGRTCDDESALETHMQDRHGLQP